MLIKYLCSASSHRYISPLHKNLSRMGYISMSQALDNTAYNMNKVINNYLFRKYEINQQMQQSLKELQRQIIASDGQYSSQQIVALREVLQNVDLTLATQKSIIAFNQILTEIKSQNILSETKSIEINLWVDKKANQYRYLNINQLLKRYQFGGSQNRARPFIILKEMEQNEKSIPIADLISTLGNLVSVQVLSNPQRRIRLQLLRRIKAQKASFEVKILMKIVKILNGVSHYDFLQEEISIAQQFFHQLTIKSQFLKENQTQLYQFFEANQDPLNILNMYQLYSDILKHFLFRIKRNNSADAHLVFQLLIRANNKIKRFNVALQQFLLKYIQMNGKYKKHNENINKGLQILLSKNCLSLRVIQRLAEVLFQINFNPTVSCIYHLVANQNYSITKVMNIQKIDKFMFITKFINQDSLSTVEYIMFAIVLHKSGSSIFSKTLQKMDKKIQQYLKCQTIFQKNQGRIYESFDHIFHLLEQSRIQNIFYQFHSIYGKLFDRIPNQLQQLYRPAQINLHHYIMKMFKFGQLQFMHQYFNDLSSIKEVIEARLQDYSNIGLQNYLIPLYYASNHQIGQLQGPLSKIRLRLLIRLSKNIRQNNISKAAQFHYWKQVNSVVSHLDSYQLCSDELLDLIEQLFTQFNSNYTEHHLTGNFYSILEKLLKSKYFQRHQLSQQHQQLKHLLVKLGLTYNLILKGHQILNKLNLQKFDAVNKQKIKYLKNIEYCSEITVFNEQTLQIVLFNHNNHHLLHQHKQEINEIVAKSTNKQLQSYIINFNQPYLDKSSRYRLVNIINTLAIKLDPATYNRYMVLRSIEKNYLFNLNQSHVLLLKWIQHFVENHQRIGDLPTHFLTLLLSTRYNRQNNQLVTKYINIIFQQSKIYPSNYYQQHFYLQLISTNHKFSRQQLAKMAQSQQSFSIPSIFFFLESQFEQKQRHGLLNKIISIIQQQYKQIKQLGKKKINIISDYQYRYLTQKYQKQFKSIINIPFTQFKNEKFSEFVDKDRQLLNEIAQFQKTKLIRRTDFGDNQIYQIKDNYIINLPFKPSAIYKFAYYERMLKANYGSNIKVTITLFDQQNAYVDIKQMIKLSPILTQQQWQEFFFDRTVSQNQQQKNKQQQSTPKRQRKKKKLLKINQPRKRGFFSAIKKR